jgi:hypothetical protein
MTAQEDQDDIGLWRWLHTMLMTYGADGMSSDKTVCDPDTKKRTYKTRSVPWRRNIDKELEILQKTRVRDGFSPKGRTKADCLRLLFNKWPPTTRLAQRKLPEVYYDEDYIRGLNNFEHANLKMDRSQQRNKWPHLTLHK